MSEFTMTTETTTNALLHVYQAINSVQKKLSETGVSKGRKNQQQGYSFRGIDDIYNALSGIMASAELCILPVVLERTFVERTTQKGNALFYVTVKSDFHFVSSRDGSRHVVTTYGEAMDSADKATNKAMSAAYKYACMQAFCIPTEGDNDADTTTHDVVPKITPEAVDKEKVFHAVVWFKEMLDADNIEENWKVIQAGWSKLSNNEKMEVDAQLKDKAPNSNVMYKNLLKKYLDYVPSEGV